MAIPMGVQTMIGDKNRLDDRCVRPHGDHCQVAHIQVYRNGHQVRIELAFLDLFGDDFFGLGKV